MSLNKCELPVSLIAGLYHSNLIEGDKFENNLNPVVTGNGHGIQFLGENNKGICMLVNYKNDVYLPDKELDFLISILHACKLNLGDVAIINCKRLSISFEDLKKQTPCNFVLLFGMSGTEIGLPFNKEFIVEKINNCSVVVSPAIEKLNGNTTEAKLLKSKLWLCLRQLLNV